MSLTAENTVESDDITQGDGRQQDEDFAPGPTPSPQSPPPVRGYPRAA